MKKEEKQSRNVTLDCLKWVGLICIIFAHADPSPIWFQLRNFDVPLMVMISVWLSLKTINRPDFNYREFLTKRFKRLVIPTWLFLVLFFCLQVFLFRRTYDWKTTLSSFLLMKGIGFVWVIRIYLTIAIVLPLLKPTQKWSHLKTVLIGILWYFVYHLIVLWVQPSSPDVRILIETFIFDPLGYGWITYMATWFYRLSRKQILSIGALFGLIYIGIGSQNHFLPTQGFKYPVQLYYLSYAFLMSLTLYGLLSGLESKKWLKPTRFWQWTSEHSLWLYLWHVLSLLCLREISSYQTLNVSSKFILLTGTTLLLTSIQQLFKRRTL